jgi:hypothetical protein
MKKYSKKRDGCTTVTITVCGVALSLFSDIQAKHKVATGRHLSNQQAFNYIMNDYNNLRNK